MFDGCFNLTSISIPNSVTCIENRAFYDCERLKSITIPNSLKSIGVNAFTYCRGLEEVNYKGTETEWQKISIEDCNENLTNAKRNYI